jgi:hypothetical protein
MKFTSILTTSLMLTITVTAQVTGSGSSGSVPVWTSSTSLGDSALVQGPGPRIGLGTNSPQAKLEIVTKFSPALRARALSPGFGKVGIVGTSSSEAGTGIVGIADFSQSPTESPSANVGIIGQALGAITIGVMGQSGSSQCADTAELLTRTRCAGGIFTVTSPNATAGVFQNPNRGNLLVGESVDLNTNQNRRVFRVDGEGFVFATSFHTGGADFAEAFVPVGDKAGYEPGDVLAIAGSRHVTKISEPYSTRVLGVYSTAPGVIARPGSPEDPTARNEMPVAVVGIVPCKVTDEGGPINPGDLLVSSSTPGYAMRGVDRSRLTGAVLGKALSALQSGKGTIEVLVMLR